jgi:hypothetical protein
MTDEPSIFDESLLPQDNTQEPEKFFEALVGEDKKFKDPEALARGKWESDKYVETLKQQLAEKDKELKSRVSIEEFLEKISSNAVANPPATPGNDGTPPAQNTTPAQALNKNDLLSLVHEAMTQEKIKTTRQQNVAQVAQDLKKAWGPNYVSVLEGKLVELGLGKNFAEDMIARAPEAFKKLVGLDQPTTKVNNFTPPQTNARQEATTMVSGSARNQAWWDNLKKSDPKQYEAMTVQRHKDAQELGMAYFNK